MAPQLSRPDPPFMQVVKHIRQQILAGELCEGDSIPSARTLTQEWRISMATATKVLAALKSEGLVRTVQGVGTVVSVAESLKHAPKDRIQAVHRAGRIYTPGEYAKILTAELVDAPDQVADALGLRAGHRVIRRRRITHLDDLPISTSISWFDGGLADAAPKLLETTRLPQGTPGYIEAVTGRIVSAGRDQLTAAAATEQDADVLGLDVGAPVMRGRNWLYDADGGVVEYGESVASAGRWMSYDYEIGD